ncbi:MAG: sigma-E processing peptidase SpoIIGA [Clostridia bacterium]|nr:sigma-E processing peptidase SpoIIGA [Clostridia bacterium]
MTIYLDIVIIENLIMNYIILYATSIIAKKKIKHIRAFIASIIGTIYVIILYVTKLPIYSNIMSKLLLSIIMVYIIFKPENIKVLINNLLLFYLTSFVFGGASTALIYLIKPEEILTKNGMFLGTYTLKTVFLGGIVGLFLIAVTINIIRSKISKKDMFYNIKIYIEEKEIETRAMIDTGNLLKEPITNIPVIIVEHTLLYNVIEKEILNNLEEILSGNFEKIPNEIKNKYLSKLKVIPFKSLGKENGMLLGIKVDKVILENEENRKVIDKAIIGIYNKSLTKRGEYRALLGIDMI